MIKKTQLILLCAGLWPLVVLASGHGEAHSNEIPGVVFWQVINLSILFGGLYYFLKDKVIESFSQRQKLYFLEAEKTKKAQLEAEKSFLDIKHKLEELESTREAAIARAHAEAQEMREKLIAEANALAKKIKEEAELAARLETEKAEKTLRNKIIDESVRAAKTILSKDIGNNDHQKLQSDFTKNIQVVNL